MKEYQIKQIEITESEELVTGARLEPSNKLPIELSAAICLGCLMGFSILILISLIYENRMLH